MLIICALFYSLKTRNLGLTNYCGLRMALPFPGPQFSPWNGRVGIDGLWGIYGPKFYKSWKRLFTIAQFYFLWGKYVLWLRPGRSFYEISDSCLMCLYLTKKMTWLICSALWPTGWVTSCDEWEFFFSWFFIFVQWPEALVKVGHGCSATLGWFLCLLALGLASKFPGTSFSCLEKIICCSPALVISFIFMFAHFWKMGNVIR